ncbi:hypothetical protein V1478_001828 [Vespula squamosa]|uniref:Uncharacterized protein n=1 Tax=Vespula squamosa TaxID=30214 RepID=A0ABD2BY87_VESSQ
MPQICFISFEISEIMINSNIQILYEVIFANLCQLGVAISNRNCLTAMT